MRAVLSVVIGHEAAYTLPQIVIAERAQGSSGLGYLFVLHNGKRNGFGGHAGCVIARRGHGACSYADANIK
jgi:hypothetical protein